MTAHRTASAASGAPLQADEMVRYGRHLSLQGVGLEGQEKLKAGSVAIVGVGGLGCPAAMYLAAAGVGSIGLIDGDRIDASNLQRQVLYGDADVGKLKVDVAAARLTGMNGDVSIRPYPVRLDSGNAMDVLADYDIVLDGTDNFPARYLINDATVFLGIPSVHGSVLRFEGRVSVFGTAEGPCYRCLYPAPPPPGVVQDCRDAGVLGVMPGLIGMLQATEVIKMLCALGDSLAGRLLIVDGLGLRFQTFHIARNPDCPVCSTREIRTLIDYDAFCAGVAPADIAFLAPADVATRLHAGAQIVDVREPWEWAICRLPGATLVPLADLDSHLTALDPAEETIVYCHRGLRSLEAARRLRNAGFARVAHLDGGIDRYSAEVDASVPRY